VTLMITYIAVCASTIAFYRRERRDEFNVLLHAVIPATGIVALVAVIYYQYQPLPDFPVQWGNWYVLVGLAIGIAVMVWMASRRRESLLRAGEVFVEDEGTPEPAKAATSVS
jgi:amino acid transporter